MSTAKAGFGVAKALYFLGYVERGVIVRDPDYPHLFNLRLVCCPKRGTYTPKTFTIVGQRGEPIRRTVEGCRKYAEKIGDFEVTESPFN